MKKKILGLTAVLLIILITGLCVGCSGEKSSDKKTKSGNVNVENKSDEKTGENKKEEINQVLFDNEYCSCILTGFDEDFFEPFQLKVILENKTQDKELMFSARDGSVNGYMCDPFWADSVAAGKKANVKIGWMETTLEDAGITGDIETIELHFVVHDNNDFMSDNIVDEVITINP